MCSGWSMGKVVPSLSILLVSLAAACGGSKVGTEYDFAMTFDVLDISMPTDVQDAARDLSAFDPAELDVPCVEGVTRCVSLHTAEVCVNQEWIFNAACTNGDICMQGACVAP